jgi:hypothetical protein
MPSWLVTAVTLTFVALFTIVTVTFGAADPVGSVTRPVMVEVPICATLTKAAAHKAAASFRYRMELLSSFAKLAHLRRSSLIAKASQRPLRVPAKQVLTGAGRHADGSPAKL